MKQKSELKEMGIDKLVEFAYEKQNEAAMVNFLHEENTRLKEILNAIGIVYEVYKKNL